MIIGTITNWSEVQGQINDAPNVLAGTISSAELMGGQVVGMRGMKGDKGDDGHSPVITATKLGKVTVIAVDSVAVATIYDGADGQDGADGFSPIANVSKVGDTATITITDSLGTTTADVSDGQDGNDGADGHSPVITANKVGKVTTIYADGVAIATIKDGEDGSGGGGQNVWYGYSSSLASADPKIVTTTTGDFPLSTGDIVFVKFDNGAGTLGNEALQINVDGTGNVNVYKTSGSSGVGWTAGAVVGFVYDGSKFVAVNKSPATTMQYGETKLSTAIDSTSATLASTPSAVKQAYDLADSKASVLVAEYGVTTYADVKDAYDEDAIIICTVDDSGNTVICHLAYYDDANDLFYFAQPQSDGFYLAIIASDDTWDDSYFQFASTDTATQLRDGLMSALDWQKLDGIESGAEVNVQSDWNQSVNTADDYIKNKPTIPTSLSDLSDDSTHRLVTDTEKSTWNGKSDFSGDYDDLSNKPTLFSGDYNDLTNKPTIPTLTEYTVPSASFASGWTNYDSTSTPKIRKYGNIVFLTGAMKNTSSITVGASGITMFSIPQEYMPDVRLTAVFQGSGTNRWLFSIETDGSVVAARYTSGTTYSSVSSGAWFPFTISWILP